MPRPVSKPVLATPFSVSCVPVRRNLLAVPTMAMVSLRFRLYAPDPQTACRRLCLCLQKRLFCQLFPCFFPKPVDVLANDRFSAVKLAQKRRFRTELDELVVTVSHHEDSSWRVERMIPVQKTTHRSVDNRDIPADESGS